MLADYGMVQDTLTMFCDNTSAINISKNYVQHSKTKHIDIHHHFIRDLVESKIVSLEYIYIEKQLANIFTKRFRLQTISFFKKSLRCVFHVSQSAFAIRLNSCIYALDLGHAFMFFFNLSLSFSCFDIKKIN